MSEQAVRETEVVVGVIEGVTQKKPDTWQVEVLRPDGAQYTKKLWTKDTELVTALTAKLGQQGRFICNASYWTNQSGTQVRSLWIAEASGDGATVNAPPGVSNATPAPTPTPGTPGAQNASQGRYSQEEIATFEAKERRDYRSRAWAQTLGAFTHTIKTDEDPKDVFLRLQPFQRKVYEDVCQSFAWDDSDVPFD